MHYVSQARNRSSTHGGPVGVLLCHGFTGSPQTLRPWADYLAGQGLTVSLPRLPGHGTTWPDLARTGWQDWYAEVDRAFGALARRCEQTFVFGLSMGGCLALRLAEVHGSAVRGLVLVNPSLAPDTKLFLLAPVLKYVLRSLPGIASDIKKPGGHEFGYDRVPVRAAATLPGLWGVTDPASGRGHAAGARLPQHRRPRGRAGQHARAARRPAASQVTVRECPDSYHVATLDNDAESHLRGQRGVRAGSRLITVRIGDPMPRFIRPAADRGRLIVEERLRHAAVGTCRTGITPKAERATRTRRGATLSPVSMRRWPRSILSPGRRAKTYPTRRREHPALMVPIGLAEQVGAAGTTGRLRPAGWTGNMSGTRLTGNTSSTGRPAASADVTPAT